MPKGKQDEEQFEYEMYDASLSRVVVSSVWMTETQADEANEQQRKQKSDLRYIRKQKEVRL